jgi:hypothetical protein
MAKFYGVIGFVETEESVLGVWTEKVTEKEYFGDIIQNTKRWQQGGNLNDDIVVNNKISILADTYAFQLLEHIRYVRWMGVNWKVSNIDINSPRLILTLGGVYNGNTA